VHDARVLVIVSGLPAAGKSHLADSLGRELGLSVLSVDPIEAAIRRCGIPPSFETGLAAYEVAAVLARHQLELGLSVIVDAVSSLEVARDDVLRRREEWEPWPEERLLLDSLCDHSENLAAAVAYVS
jgi:predicted kinase